MVRSLDCLRNHSGNCGETIRRQTRSRNTGQEATGVQSKGVGSLDMVDGVRDGDL